MNSNFLTKTAQIDGFLNEKRKDSLSGDPPKQNLQPKFHAKILQNQSFLEKKARFQRQRLRIPK